MTPVRRPVPRRRGLAVLVVMWLLALLSVVLLSLTAMTAAEARRTQTHASEAQLRQLLTAGALHAQAQLSAGEALESGAIALPGPLAERAALALELLPTVAADRAALRLSAQLGSRRAAQRLTLARGPQGWELVEAALE